MNLLERPTCKMEGGPIGARCTMAASRLIMQDWSEEYEAILVRSRVRLDALRECVDDGTQFSDTMIRGTWFNAERGVHMGGGLGEDR